MVPAVIRFFPEDSPVQGLAMGTPNFCFQFAHVTCYSPCMLTKEILDKAMQLILERDQKLGPDPIIAPSLLPQEDSHPKPDSGPVQNSAL
jgi:hypothetical protein